MRVFFLEESIAAAPAGAGADYQQGTEARVRSARTFVESEPAAQTSGPIGLRMFGGVERPPWGKQPSNGAVSIGKEAVMQVRRSKVPGYLFHCDGPP